jgi:hypothetical protein
MLLMTLLIQFLVPTMRASVRGTTRVELQQMAVLAVNKLAADLQNTTAGGLGFYGDNTSAGDPTYTAAQSALPTSSGVGTGSVLEPQTKGVAINPIFDVDPTGLQQWANKIVVYAYVPGSGTWPDETGKLYRADCPPTDDNNNPLNGASKPSGMPSNNNSPWRDADTQLQGLVSPPSSQYTWTLLASNVVYFSCYTLASTNPSVTMGSDTVVSDPVYIHIRLQRTDSSTGVQGPQSFEITRTVSMKQRI